MCCSVAPVCFSPPHLRSRNATSRFPFSSTSSTRARAAWRWPVRSSASPDATAATTNPAGLQRLGRPEVSSRAAGGSSSPTSLRRPVVRTLYQYRHRHHDGPVFADTSERVAGISFLSFVYPHGRWSIAGYRQEASRLKGSATTEGAFLTDSTNSASCRSSANTRASWPASSTSITTAVPSPIASARCRSAPASISRS